VTTERKADGTLQPRRPRGVYRKEQDEKAARKTEGRSERMEKESARRAWIADGGAGADFSSASGRSSATRGGAGVLWTQTVGPARRCKRAASAKSRD